MKIEIDVDGALGALTMAMVQAVGTETARTYLRRLVEREEFWEALRIVEARGVEKFGHEVMADVADQAAINVAVASVRPKGSS